MWPKNSVLNGSCGRVGKGACQIQGFDSHQMSFFVSTLWACIIVPEHVDSDKNTSMWLKSWKCWSKRVTDDNFKLEHIRYDITCN